MIATSESLDELFAEATRQAMRNTAFVQDSARRYMGRLSDANQSQYLELKALEQAFVRAAFDLQSAGIQMSRSVVDATSQVSHALARWSVAAVGPSAPAVASPYTAEGPRPAGGSREPEPAAVDSYINSALRFQPPLGIVSAGLGESPDEE
jgi:hypothetical protein